MITVFAGGEAVLETTLSAPSGLRSRQLATIWVEYSNTGTIAMTAPLLVLDAEQNGNHGAWLTLDESLRQNSFWTSAVPHGVGHSVQFLACGNTPGILQPGETVRMPIYYVGWQGGLNMSTTINFTLGVLTDDDTSPADWSAMEETLRPDEMAEEAWTSIFAAFTAEVGNTWGDYVSMLSENAVYLRRLGETVTDVSELMAFELAQAQGYSIVGTLAGGTDAVASGPGLDIVFSRSYSESIVSRYELGSFGYGWTNNWDMSFSTRDDGTVEINYPGGSKRIFQPNVRGGYLARPGDNGTLTDRSGGGYLLRELGGSLYAFTADGKLDYVEDTNDNRITCGNDLGRLVTLTHSNGIASVTIAYNAAGRISSVTDQDDRATAYTYDESGEHLLGVTGYDGLGVGYTYNDGHALTEIAYADGTHTFYEYNELGQLDAMHADDGAGRVEIARGEGGLVTMTDTLGGQTDYYFNHNSAIEKTVDSLDRAVEMDYDSLGNMTRISDPLGRSTTYAYDKLGNVARSTNALGLSTQFSYTRQLNQLDLLTDAVGNVTDYDYDEHGNLLSITYADNSLERWGYDDSGNVDEWINRRGQSVQYTLDDEGRVVKREYGLDTPADSTDDKTVTFTYDTRGNLTESDDPTGTTMFTYDGNDYLTRIDNPDSRFLEYSYDTAGRRQSMTDELGHQANYGYDSLGRLWQLTDENAAVIVTYSYDELSRLSRTDKGNGTYTTYAYDVAGQLTSLLNHAADDSVTSMFEYTYDAAGLRASMTTLDGSWAYKYDAIGQLTQADFVPVDGSTLPAQGIAYEYDSLGNRINTAINGVETTYTSNELNQYTQVGDTTYVYDADGNLVQEISPAGTTAYTYNADNKLVAVVMPDNSVYEYTYDAFGNRVAVSVDGVVTEYVIDPTGLGNVVGQYNGTTDAWQTGYTHGIGLVNQTTAASSYFYDFDALGSTAAMTDALGTAVNTYAYLPFGGELAWTETVANDFQFVGQWGVMNEDNGLEFMRARFYDSTLAQFMSQDPLGLNGGQINLYTYATNSPTQFNDPTGLMITELTLGVTIVGAYIVNQIAVAGVQFINSPIGQIVGGHVGGYGNPSLPSNLYEMAGQLTHHLEEVGEVANWFMWNLVESLKTSWEGWRLISELIIDAIASVEWRPEDGWDYATSFRGLLGSLIPPAILTGLDLIRINPVRSVDPNDKLGPAGYGDDNFIAVDVDQSMPMPYTIRFENKADATAPAQWIRVTDTFDEDLDLTTFELTEFMLGGEIFVIPAGLDSYQAQLERTIEGNDLVIDVDITLDWETRTLSSSFMALDPLSGWMPENPLVGLLYPNDEFGRGNGSVSYVVDTLAGLPSGRRIENEARIYFDFNDPIDTPLVVNTIDAAGPTSYVNPLPATVTKLTFPVSWISADDDGGSGIASHDIYVSADDGPFELWLDDTTDTSATFNVGLESSYAFYSVATDNVGRQEPAPTVPDTQTTFQFTTPFILFSTSLVRQPTETNSEDEVLLLPASDDWIEEWSSFYVEIWVKSTDTTFANVVTAQVDLTFNYDCFTATSVEYGDTFDQSQTVTVDNETGIIDDLRATTSRDSIGDDRHVLLARIRFEPTESDPGISLEADGNYPHPIDNDIELSYGLAYTADDSSLNTALGVGPATELWPAIYDIDNNGEVGLGDLAFFAGAYRENVAESTNPYAPLADFDHNGIVNLGDLAFFASAYRQTKTDALELPHSPNWPWETSPAVATSQTAAVIPTVATLSTPPLIPGDANRDGTVNDIDASALATNWQKQTAATWSNGDFNGDGLVNDADATILAQHWMMTADDSDDDDERDAVFAEVGAADDPFGLFDE